MKDKFQDTKFNIILIFIFEIITSAIAFTANFTGAGMAAIIIKWIPAGIGLITIIVYLASSLLFKKNNWIITLTGIILMLTVAIKIHTTNFQMS